MSAFVRMASAKAGLTEASILLNLSKSWAMILFPCKGPRNIPKKTLERVAPESPKLKYVATSPSVVGLSM